LGFPIIRLNLEQKKRFRPVKELEESK